jgi:hypothetical protein
VKTATAAATSTAAATAAATATTAAGQEHQWCSFPVRRRGGDIADHAAAPGGRGGRRFRGHQPDQRGRRYVKQALSHRCGLTPWIWPEFRSGSRLLGARCRPCPGIAGAITDNTRRTWSPLND